MGRFFVRKRGCQNQGDGSLCQVHPVLCVWHPKRVSRDLSPSDSLTAPERGTPSPVSHGDRFLVSFWVPKQGTGLPRHGNPVLIKSKKSVRISSTIPHSSFLIPNFSLCPLGDRRVSAPIAYSSSTPRSPPAYRRRRPLRPGGWGRSSACRPGNRAGRSWR